MFMFGVTEFLIFADFETSKFEVLSNPEYQLLIFKEF
jgi:hypothetical protein